MDKIFYLLVATAALSLTYLAYKRPEKYERLFNSLYVIVFIVYACLSIWNTAMMRALIALTPFIEKNDLGSAKAAIEALQIPWLPLHAIMGSLFIYFLFLSFLPKIRMRQKEQQEKEKVKTVKRVKRAKRA